MIPVIFLGVFLSAAICTLAFLVATYALPFIVGVAAFRIAVAYGEGWIVAGATAFTIGVTSFAVFVYLRTLLRNPLAKTALCVAYAVPSAVAGYSLMHGLLRDAPIREAFRQVLCIGCGAIVGTASFLRLRNFA